MQPYNIGLKRICARELVDSHQTEKFSCRFDYWCTLKSLAGVPASMPNSFHLYNYAAAVSRCAMALIVWVALRHLDKPEGARAFTSFFGITRSTIFSEIVKGADSLAADDFIPPVFVRAVAWLETFEARFGQGVRPLVQCRFTCCKTIFPRYDLYVEERRKEEREGRERVSLCSGRM